MTALVAGEVQGNVSPVAGSALLFAKSKETQRQDFADLAEALGGSHQVGIEGVLGHAMRSAFYVDGVRPRISTEE
jgi:hypothetical protein